MLLKVLYYLHYQCCFFITKRALGMFFYPYFGPIPAISISYPTKAATASL